jgi:regulator of protease activity HflC (stomatin/prohibitin superfamily)
MLLNNTLNIITMAAWILLVVYVVLTLVRTTLTAGFAAALSKLLGGSLFYISIATIIAVTLFSMSLVFIEPQEGGVVVSLLTTDGYRDRPLRSGVHWIVPIMEQVTRYPISMQTYTMSASPMEDADKGNDSISARTSDGQEVTIDCSVMFSLDPEQLIRLHIDWQSRYIMDFIRPAVRGIVRTQISQYTVDEVNSSKRLDMEKGLEAETRKWFTDKGIILDHFVLRNISFSDEYAAAVEQKQIALQKVAQKRHEAESIQIQAQADAGSITIRAKADANAIEMKAKAEALALKLLAESLKLDPNLVTLRYVDKLGPAIQVMLVPNNAPFLLPLPSMGPALPTANVTPSPTPQATETLLPTETATATPTP